VKTVSVGNTAGPELLCLLTKLVKMFYPPEHGDVVTLFDMVTSHSEFLNVMLSYHSSDIKSRLAEFLYTLMQLNKGVMKSQHIPVYLSAYHATRSPTDRLILAMLFFYESNGQPVNEYKPYVFGDSAANHYAVRKSRTSSLWGHPTPNRVLNLFNRDVIERTVRNFPVTQKLEYHYELNAVVESQTTKDAIHNVAKESLLKVKVMKDNESAIKNLLIKAKYKGLLEVKESTDIVAVSHSDEDSNIYDPVFLFPLLSHMLAPGSVASCFKLLKTGLLSLPVMALSSQCPMMRAAAYHVLHRFCLLLETET
jgi:nucleolar pre-ribosomal-associated protein 1